MGVPQSLAYSYFLRYIFKCPFGGPSLTWAWEPWWWLNKQTESHNSPRRAAARSQGAEEVTGEVTSVWPEVTSPHFLRSHLQTEEKSPPWNICNNNIWWCLLLSLEVTSPHFLRRSHLHYYRTNIIYYKTYTCISVDLCMSSLFYSFRLPVYMHSIYVFTVCMKPVSN